MSVRYILNLAGELPEQLYRVVKEVGGLEIYDDINLDISPTYIFVENYLTSYSYFREIYSEEKLPMIISLSEVESMADFVRSGGHGVLDPSLLNKKIGEVILTRFFGGKSSLKVEDLLAEDAPINEFRLTSHLSSGHYSDVISVEAFDTDFDVVNIKSFFTSVTAYFSYLVQENICKFPIDVHFGKNEDCFYVQLTASAEDFVKDLVWQSLNRDNKKFAFQRLMSICHDTTDVLDIYYYEKSSKLVITGLWKSLKDRPEVERGSTFLINSIPSYEKISRKNQEILASPDLYLDMSSKDLLNVLENKKLPGELLPLLSRERGVFQKRPMLLAKLVDYVGQKNRNQKEGSSKQASSAEIDKLLEDFPLGNLRGKLSRTDYIIMQKLLDDPSLLGGIKDKIAEEMERVGKECSQGELVNAALGKFSLLELEQLKQMISTFGEDEVRIKGVTEQITEETIKVGGRYDEDSSITKVSGGVPLDDDHSVRIKNVTQHLNTNDPFFVSGGGEVSDEAKLVLQRIADKFNDEKWEMARSSIVESINTRIQSKKLDPTNGTLAREEFSNFASKELDIPKKMSDKIVKDVFSHAVDDIIEDTIGSKIEEVIQNHPREIKDVELLSELKNKEEQIQKLTYELDVLKGKKKKIIDVKNSSPYAESLDEIHEDSSQDLPNKEERDEQLAILKNEVEKREKEIKNLHQKFSKVAKGELIDQEVLGQFTQSGREKQLAEENRVLRTQLRKEKAKQMAAQKEQELMENTQATETKASEYKQEAELNRVKKQLDDAELKVKSLELRLKRSKVDAANTKDTSSEISPDEMRKLQRMTEQQKNYIDRLKDDLKKSNDGIAKEGAKVKKLNQQLQTKMREIGQVKKEMLALQAKNKDGNSAQAEKLSQHVTALNEKLRAEMKDMSNVVIEKKREAQKLGHENMALRNKISQLEKIIAKLEKNAA